MTRLGVEWEWITLVTVSREGGFTRSGVDEVHEAEIFEGAENRLTMKQTYTWEFQCKYELQRYPFDIQVKDYSNIQPPIIPGVQDQDDCGRSINGHSPTSSK